MGAGDPTSSERTLWTWHVRPRVGSEVNEPSPMAGSRLGSSASSEGEIAPAEERVEAPKLPKFAARVSVLPLDEIFLGLAVASIVVLFEIAVLVLLVN
jgi:hypothetical protein